MTLSGLKMAILAIAIATILRCTSAQTTHTVGAALGWLVPPGGSVAYEVWAATRIFAVGDVLEFKFREGDQDVARVTKEAFNSCNSTNPISVETKSPAKFTLDNIGEYYFIGTMEDHCKYGQKLAINVTEPRPGPTPSPAPRSGPLSYTVGEGLGWFVPPGGPLFYEAWAYDKTFEVGDTLVFNFINGTTDVAVVNKTIFQNCAVKNISAAAVYPTSPARITLSAAGELFFTSTFDHYCKLGQKLAINVTAAASPAPPSSGGGAAKPPTSPSSPSTSLGPSAAPPPVSSAPRVSSGGYYFASSLILVIATLAFMMC